MNRASSRALTLSSLLPAVVLLMSAGCEKLDIPMPGTSQEEAAVENTAPVTKQEEPAAPAEPEKKDATKILASVTQTPTLQVTDAQLIELSESETGLENVMELKLAGARLTARGLAAIAALPSLKTLDLNSCAIHPNDWAALSGAVHLEHLNLSKTSIDNNAIAALSEMTQLRTLNLTDSRVSDPGFAHLTKLSALEEIYLSGLRIEGSGMEALGRKGANAPLKIIYAAATQFGYLGFIHIGDFDDLRELNVVGSTVTDASLKGLRDLSSLERLFLSNNPITDEGLKALKKLKHLKVLNLDGIRTISNVSLERFSRFDDLEELRVNDSACTLEGVQAFKKRLPNCRVRLQNQEY